MDEYIVSVDMGSPIRGTFGWCDNQGNSGDDIDDLVEHLLSKSYFSLGIEAPLFIPIRSKSLASFTRKRDFEEARPWSAGAGACVTAINIGFLCSILPLIHEKNPNVELTTDIAEWKKRTNNCILIWESFITGKVHSTRKASKTQDSDVNQHIQDARTAMKKYESDFDPISNNGYLNLPLAIAKEIGMNTIASSTQIIIIGDK